MHGAYLSHLLADLAYDLGSTLTAKAFAIDCHELASQAGHGELCAWAADTLATTWALVADCFSTTTQHP